MYSNKVELDKIKKNKQLTVDYNVKKMLAI